MTFNDWFEERLIEVENDEYLSTLEYGYLGASKETIEKIYDLFKDDFDMIDFIDIVYCKECEFNIKYHIVFKNDLINYESLIHIVKLFNTNIGIANTIKDINLFSNLFVNPHKINIMNDKFYCLMSLSPKHVYPEYIVQFEDYASKFIPKYTDINELRDIFTTECMFNPEFNAIIQTNFEFVGFVCFETKDQLEEYKTKIRESIITDDDLEDAKSKLESVSIAVKDYISNNKTLLN